MRPFVTSYICKPVSSVHTWAQLVAYLCPDSHYTCSKSHGRVHYPELCTPELVYQLSLTTQVGYLTAQLARGM